MNWKRLTGLILTFAGLLFLILKLTHAYDPTPGLERFSTKLGAGVAQTVHRLQPERVTYGLLMVLPICVGAGLLFWASKSQPKTAAAELSSAAEAATPVTRPAKVRSGRASIHSCNVLHVAPDARHLWQFDARNGGFALNRQQTSLGGEALPPGLVSKDWRTLFQPKLNVAWLPPENVFLRVAQFPRGEFKETLSMVELQLEKLSPFPVAQIVWSIHVLPHTGGQMQTVIAVIVARDVVEEFLGQLEGQGYLADRLELPVLDQIQATAVSGDGAWIYPDALGGKNTGLTAWWYGGVLQNLDRLTLSDPNHPDSLREQLTQIAWAGELEGWLTSPPRWHLVASSSAAALWDPALRKALDQPIDLAEPVPAPRLAALTAQRATHADPTSNLLPSEFAIRYHQQFVDRLWMRGLLAIGVLYLLGVAVYGTALGFAIYRTKGVEQQAASISIDYTNTVKLREVFHLLNDRNELKYAGLDCWKAVAETLPETVTLESWNFGDGKKLALAGTVPIEQVSDLRKFEKAMRGNSIFGRGRGDDLNYRQSAPGTYTWSFSVELKRGEEL